MRKLALIALTSAALGCSHARSVQQAQTPPPGAAPPHDPGTVPRATREEPGTRSPAKQHEKETAPPLAASPAGLLQPGAVKRIQAELVRRDYLPEGERSGTLDGATQKALRKFQRDQGLPATGSPDDLTLRKLGLPIEDMVRPGRSGD